MAQYESLDAQCFVKRKYKPLFSGPGQLPELLYACHVREDISSRHPRIMHSHKDLAEIVLIYQGTGNYMINNRKHTVKKGDLLIYNAGVVHDENPAPDTNLAFYTIAVGSLHLPGLPENTIIPTDMGVRFHTTDSYNDLLCLFRMIFDNLAEDKPDNERFCNDLLHALLGKVLSVAEYLHQNPEASDSSEIFDSQSVLTDQVMKFVDENYMNPITIQEIADALYASPYYISHVFKRETGYSPIQYLLRRRIGEAQTLLIRTNTPIVDIAGIVGYDSQSYFTSQFTRYVGMPPKQYRIKYRK